MFETSSIDTILLLQSFIDRVDPEPFCVELKRLFTEKLKAYDLKLLSKIVLFDDSNFGSYKNEMKKIADASRKAGNNEINSNSKK